jgi:hypothetical protein
VLVDATVTVDGHKWTVVLVDAAVTVGVVSSFFDTYQ